MVRMRESLRRFESGTRKHSKGFRERKEVNDRQWTIPHMAPGFKRIGKSFLVICWHKIDFQEDMVRERERFRA